MRPFPIAPEPSRDEVRNNFLSKGFDLAHQLIRWGNGPEHEFGAALINIGTGLSPCTSLPTPIAERAISGSADIVGKSDKKRARDLVGLFLVLIDVGENQHTGFVRVHLAVVLLAVGNQLL